MSKPKFYITTAIPYANGAPHIGHAYERIATDAEALGLTVVIDDRVGVSPGVKFKDAELLGFPTIIVAGRGVAQGTVEVRDRLAGTTSELPIAEAATHAHTLSTQG